MKSFVDLADQMTEAGVRYVLVGGLAVVLHGHHRLTGDVDIVLAMDRPNLDKAIEVFESRGLVPKAPVALSDLAQEDVRQSWIDTKGLVAFSMYDPRDPSVVIDVLLEQPLEFDELERDLQLKPLGRATVPVASIPHLIKMKQAVGRALDMDDIEALRRIANVE